MLQPTDELTLQLYETFHVSVNVQRDRRTYDHFTSAHSRTMRQEQLLTTYLEQMTDAIREEISNSGNCWLLRAIIQQELPAIHLLDRSAIALVYASVFTPDEMPRLDARTIPYSASYSPSAGGMRFADRHARTTTIDLRTDAALHPLCHALLAYAQSLKQEAAVHLLEQQALDLQHHINSLRDHILGQERDIFTLEQALCDARGKILSLTAGPEADEEPVETEAGAEEAPTPEAPAEPTSDAPMAQ